MYLWVLPPLIIHKEGDISQSPLIIGNVGDISQSDGVLLGLCKESDAVRSGQS